MSIQRPQHKTTTSDLFICFTSSKSVLAHNGSIRKGAQSPAMFPIKTTSKNSKKNKSKSTFTTSSNNNHEPSSPKVTCIGQVRVKTKKQGKKMKMLAFRKMQNGSRNNSNNGNNSNSQRWVHLPFTICESLKGLGCDFGCSKYSCFGGGGKKGKSCCWRVSFQENEGKKGVDLVVNDGSVVERVCSRRRSIFDDVEFDDLFNGGTGRDDNGSGSGHVNDDGIRDDNGSGSGHGPHSQCNGIRNDNGSGSGEVNHIDIRSRDDNGSGSGGINHIDIRNRGDNESGFGHGQYNRIKNRDDNGSGSGVVGYNGIRNRDDNGIRVFRDVNGSGFNRGNGNGIRVFRDDNGLGLGRGNGNGIRDDNGSGSGGDDECGRDSICVPPKNALLLMRCRSDPSRMASLSHKFWDPPLVEHVDEGDFRVDCEDNVLINGVNHGKIDELVVNEDEIEEIKVDQDEEIVDTCDENVEDDIQEELVLQNVDETQMIEGLNEGDECSIDTITVEETVEEGEDCESRDSDKLLEDEKGEMEEGCVNSSNNSSEESKEMEEPKIEKQEKARKSIDKENKNKSMLPDCLLLMMCEPKLSMEVSKETWVCSNDFLRCLPDRNKNKKGSKPECGDDPISSNGGGNGNGSKKTKAAAVAAHPRLPPLAKGGRSGIQPGRSSISFPTGAGSVANLIEEKLAKAGVGFEPLALTRCKSAPLRSTGKFVPPELACSVWGRGNGTKLEPHRPGTCGVGAAGVGA